MSDRQFNYIMFGIYAILMENAPGIISMIGWAILAIISLLKAERSKT